MSEMAKTEKIDLEDGRTVPVDALPYELRQAIRFFDRVNYELTEATFKRDTLAVAAQAARASIMADVMKVVGPAENVQSTEVDSETPDASNDGGE
jgi:hypothetical protein